MTSIDCKKITEDQFKEKLVKMFKDGNIKFSDIPKKHREFVAMQIFGRYPLKDFSSLNAVIK